MQRFPQGFGEARIAMLTCSAIEEPGAPAWTCLCHSPVFARLQARLDAKFSRRAFMGGAAAGAAALAFAPKGADARVPAPPETPIALTNCKLFDGTSAALRSGFRVLVEGQRIRAVEA